MSQKDAPPDAAPGAPSPAQADGSGPRAPRAALWLAAAALLLATVALLGQFGHLAAGLLGLGRLADADEVKVDAQAFKDYFTVQKQHLARGGRALVLTLKRTGSFPLKDADFETVAERTTKAIPALLALEAVARGYVRCEYFAEKGEFLGFTWERIRGLADHEAIELSLPVAGRAGLARVVITY